MSNGALPLFLRGMTESNLEDLWGYGYTAHDFIVILHGHFFYISQWWVASIAIAIYIAFLIALRGK